MMETGTGSRAGRAVRIALLLGVVVTLAACGRVGGPAPLVEKEDELRSVVVRQGETLYAIARRFQVPLRDLIEFNGIAAPFKVLAGRRLKLPTAREHVVKKGETVYGVSRRYGIDMTALVKLNGIQPPYRISIGRRLRIPGSTLGGKRIVARAVEPPKHLWQRPPDRRGAKKSKPAPRKRAPVAVPPPGKGRKFAWPLRGRVIASFGPHGGGLHNDGINIAARKGAPIRAAAEGTVAYAGNELQGFGNLLLIRHSGGWMTAYGHAAKLTVRRGQRVRRGQTIGRVGSSGNVSSPQLHFEIRRGEAVVNPARYLSRASVRGKRVRSAAYPAARPNPG